MSNFGFISKKKVAREIAKIYNSHKGVPMGNSMYYFDSGACSALNILCRNLDIVPMHRNKLGKGTGEMCGKMEAER